MSEQPPASETRETVVVDQGAGGLNPLYVALGVVLALAAVALLWIFVIDPLVLADDPDPDPVAVDTTPTPAPEVPDATPTPVPEGELDPEVLPIETVEVFLASDPFRPVRPEEPLPADPDDPTDPTDPTDPSDPTDPTDPDDPPDELPPTNDDEDPPDRAEHDRRQYVLIDVFTEDGEARAVMEVDGQRYEVTEGEVFLQDPQTRIQRIRVDDGCVDFLHGDVSDTLCEGERVLK